MAVRWNIIIYFASVILVQLVSAQIIGRGFNAPPFGGNLELPDFGRGFNNQYSRFPISNGGTFSVTSSSPGPPNGISVLADNLKIEGSLAVAGNMPFLGSVTLDGTVPAVGQSSVNYGCGSGNVGITSEGFNPVGNNPGLRNAAIENQNGGLGRFPGAGFPPGLLGADVNNAFLPGRFGPGNFQS